MRLAIRRAVCAAAVTLGLVGCTTVPDPIYYLLPTPEVAAGAPYSGGTIAVREIAMPLYARAQQVASLDPAGSVTLSDDHRWADEPARASTLAFVAALKQITGAPIVAEPWPNGTDVAVRVDITVERLIGDLAGGDVDFSGQYRIVNPSGGGTGQQSAFTFRVNIEGPGYKPLAQAHSDAIGLLAQEIAVQIASGGV